MIFRVKHSWLIALAVTLGGLIVSWAIGSWSMFLGDRYSVAILISVGVGGALAALVVNAVLHEIFKRTIGKRYLQAFDVYGQDVLNGMHWPEYVMGGVMAALVEEPIFRGSLLPAIEGTLGSGAGSAVIAIFLAAFVFAIFHWLRAKYFPFWIWAMWEGVWFGIMFVLTGSLLAPMIAHGIHDVIAYRVFQTLVRDAPKPEV